MKLSAARLKRLIEEAIVDAYGESEQRVGFLTMIQENLTLPFVTHVLGVEVTVERIDFTRSLDIVAICRRGRKRQAISLLELPLQKPAPQEAEWISRRTAAGHGHSERRT